ncbi:MAG: hypothetical protein R6V10_16545 [bacterium]
MSSWDLIEDVRMPSGAPVAGPYLGRIIEELSLALVPDGGELAVSVYDTGSFNFIGRYLRDSDAGARRGIKALLVLFDLLPFLFIGRLRRFVNLAPAEKELYLADWEASRIYYRRMVLVLLKTIVGMGYYNDKKVLSEIGYKLKCEGDKN